MVFLIAKSKKQKIDKLLLEGRPLSNEEIAKRWPDFRVPDNMLAFMNETGGVCEVAKSLETFKNLSIKHGADLRYKAAVKTIDHEGKRVTLEDGTVYSAKKNIVICCGAMTDQFYTKLG